MANLQLRTMGRRTAECVVSEAEFRRFLAGVTSPRLRDIVQVLWLTGCRPSSLFRATAANLTDDGTVLIFERQAMLDRGERASKTGDLEAGMNPVDVAALGGHLVATMLRNYSHVAANWKRLHALANKFASPIGWPAPVASLKAF